MPSGPDGAGPTGASPGRGRGDGGRGRGEGGRGSGHGSHRGGGRGRGDERGRGDGNPWRSGGHRGRGRGRGGGQGSGRRDEHGDGPSHRPEDAGIGARPQTATEQGPAPAQEDKPIAKSAEEAADEDADADLCFICANPVTHHAIAPCNHITCHICALRMRALYKTKDCPHCRTAGEYVIFTDDASKKYDEYTPADISSTNSNIGIKYTNENIVGDTVLLLRYNCPDSSCDFAGLGWPDLHRHVRSVHHKKMCDLCTRNKKVFTHEHELFSDKALEKHMRHGDDRPGAVDQTGFRGHPLCGFCGERFYDDDKLFEHCRNKHERCFLCDRRDPRQPHYYLDYNALEQHFRAEHFLCMDKECLEKKFVVFATEMDLKAHQLSEHGDSLSKDVRRDARTVDMSGFDFRQTYQQERRSGGGREGRGRGRDPNADALPRTSAQPLRRDELAFHRQMAIQSAQSVTSRTFGGQLTQPSSSSSAPNNNATARLGGSSPLAGRPVDPLPEAVESLHLTDPESLTPQERARLVRHGAVVERASNLLGNDSSKMTAFRSYITSYRTGKITAPQLIDAFFTLFSDSSSNALGTLVREVADLFEDKVKAEALRKSWQDWRAINEDYPTLPGFGGMHGETSSSSGWAAAVAASPAQAAVASAPSKHTTRVLKLKNSTLRGNGPASGPAPPMPVGPTSIRRLPASAPSNSLAAMPPLPGSSGSVRGTPSWAGTSRTAGVATSTPPGLTGQRRGLPAASSEDAFPALPAAPKPLTTIFGYGTGSVRRDLGTGRGTGFAWGAATPGSDTGQVQGGGDNEEGGEEGGRGKKKGKQGKKQVLVQWG